MIEPVIIQKYKTWRFKNTFLLIVSLLIFFYFAQTDFVQQVILGVGGLGYLGAIFSGVFFVSTFTVAPAGLVLFFLAGQLDPLWVAIMAGLGAMFGDYFIFRFLKDKVFQELQPIFMRLGGSYLSRLLSTPYFLWLSPVIGALIIASPFPDEIGISLMGMSKLKNWQFLVFSFVLNVLGILAIIMLAKSLS